MYIDPKVMKELLKLELLNKSGLLSGGAPAALEDGGTDFAGLLQGLLDKSAGTSAPAAASGPARTALKPVSYPAVASAYAYGSRKPGTSKPTDYEPYIEQASKQFGVQSSLVKAVIDAESSFNSRAVSRAGAKGLMQLMDGTAEGLGVTNPFDPQQNIKGGTRYLSGLLGQYEGNEAMALAAYNAGAGRVNRLGVSNDRELMEKLHMLPQETQHYVRKVLQLKQGYAADLS